MEGVLNLFEMMIGLQKYFLYTKHDYEMHVYLKTCSFGWFVPLTF